MKSPRSSEMVLLSSYNNILLVVYKKSCDNWLKSDPPVKQVRRPTADIRRQSADNQPTPADISRHQSTISRHETTARPRSAECGPNDCQYDRSILDVGEVELDHVHLGRPVGRRIDASTDRRCSTDASVNFRHNCQWLDCRPTVHRYA